MKKSLILSLLLGMLPPAVGFAESSHERLLDANEALPVHATPEEIRAAIEMSGFTLEPSQEDRDEAASAVSFEYALQGLPLSMSLDLADDMQFQFVLNRLLSTGKTIEESPNLFRRLVNARELALEDGARETTGDPTTCVNYVDLQGVSDLTGPSADSVYAHATGTCYNTSTNGSVVITSLQLDAMAEYRLSTGSTSNATASAITRYNLSTWSEVSVKASSTVPSNAVLQRVSSQIIATVNGLDYIGYSELETTYTNIPAAPSHPLNYNTTNDTIAGEYTIKMCFDRTNSSAGYSDCDYFHDQNCTGNKICAKGWTSSTTTPTLEFQTEGTYTSGSSTVFVPLYAQVSFSGQVSTATSPVISARGLFQKKEGAICQVSNLAQYISCKNTSTSRVTCTLGKLGTNNVPKALPFSSACLVNTNSIQLWSSVLVKDTNGRYWTWTWDSKDADGYGTNNGLNTLSGTTKPSTFTNLWSCLAEDSEVLMADGSRREVKDVLEGEQVMVNENGQTLTVTGYSRGAEEVPMVFLRDDLGHQVLVTQGHPVVTADRQVVKAGSLEVGDVLLTEAGPAVIEQLEARLYDGLVYNLKLGTSDELAALGQNATTFYANGLLVGDSQMQFDLDVREHSVDTESLAIAPEWGIDYLNALTAERSL